MRFDVLTLFPDIFSGYLGQSILHKALENKLVDIHVHNLRDWSTGKHKKLDDTPYGGGAGMILMVEPLVRAVRDVQNMTNQPGLLVLLSPQGRRLEQPWVESLAGNCQRLIILCGRYEGFDQRVIDILQPVELSIGDYILNGGEVAAMVLIDSLVRMVPGVLGDAMSNVDDSFSSGNRWLEYPQYTRPREFEGHAVPDILLSGNHQQIEKWRIEQSQRKTAQRRADLLDS